jgi:translocation and assembly module TamB
MASEAQETDHIAARAMDRWCRSITMTLIFLLSAAAFIVWLSGTSSGAYASFRLLDLMTKGRVQAKDIRGSFMHQLQISQLTITTPEEKITINDLRLNWRLSALVHRLLHVDRLHIGTLVIQTSWQTSRPLRRLPSSLQLPFDVILDRCDIDRLSVQPAHQDLATIKDLELGWRFEKMVHILRLQTAQMTQYSDIHTDSHLKAYLHLQASAPFAIRSDIQLQGIKNGWHLEATGNLSGTLNDIAAHMVMRLGQPNTQTQLYAQVQLQPFSSQLISAGELKAEQVDLSKINPDWPTTQITLHAAITKKEKGIFSIHNALDGTWDKSRLPVKEVSGYWSFQDDEMILENFHINHDNLTGSMKIRRDECKIFLKVKNLNLRNIDSRLRNTDLNGAADFIYKDKKTYLRIALSEPWQLRSLQIHTEALIDKSLLTVRSAQLSLGDTVANISGDVLLSGSQTFDIRGDVRRLRLAELGKFSYLPDMTLTSRFNLKGQRHPDLQLALDFSVTHSRIGRYPVNGEGTLRLDKNLFRISGLTLRAGDNFLQANGELSKHHGELSFFLKASQLSQLGSSFSGQLTMRGNISGNLQQPRFFADWQGHDLCLPGEMSVRGTQGQLQLGGNLSSPLSLHAYFQDTVVSNISLASAYIDIDGKPEQHTLLLRLTDRQTHLHLSASGGVDAVSKNATWRGRLKQATMAGMINAYLEQSAAIVLSKDHLQLDHLYMSSDLGHLIIDHFRHDNEAIVSRGHVAQLHIGHLASALRIISIMQSDLQLDGEWDLSLPQKGQIKPQGLVTLRRTRGDLRFSDTQSTALQLQQLGLNLQLRDGRLSLRFEAQGQRLGQLSFVGGTLLGEDKFFPEATAPVDGVLKVNLPLLDYIGPLLSPNLTTAGHMSAQVSVTGNFLSPLLTGTISAEQLHLQWLDQGLSLTDGVLQADLQDDQLQLRRLSFAGSRNSTSRMNVSGLIRLKNGSLESYLNWHAKQFSLLNRSDRRLILTGAGLVSTLAHRARLSGELNVDEGFVDLGREEVPQLSDDVIVVGKPLPSTPTLGMEINLGLGLGEKLLIRGRGINARLGGALTIKSKPGEAISAYGLMQLTRGSYTAYGRELAIERGTLRFDGPPGNPALDIRAMRRGSQVESGVMITGTMLAPRLRLISEPQVPDAEKISWLVLGQGLSGTTDQQAGVLQDAAASLLTQSAAARVQSQIAGSLGLDRLTLSRRPDNVQQRIITLGKRISSRLYVSYQQGLQAAGAAVLLRYTLSNKITIEAETGTRSVFSLLYNFSFD